MLITTLVGAAIARPPCVANIVYSLVMVEADTEIAGSLLAAQIVASRPDIVMPTSTEVIDVVP